MQCVTPRTPDQLRVTLLMGRWRGTAVARRVALAHSPAVAVARRTLQLNRLSLVQTVPIGSSQTERISDGNGRGGDLPHRGAVATAAARSDPMGPLPLWDEGASPREGTDSTLATDLILAPLTLALPHPVLI